MENLLLLPAGQFLLNKKFEKALKGKNTASK